MEEEIFDDEIQKIYDEAELREIMELELEFSMRTAYEKIYNMGWETWIEKVPFSFDRKKVIMRNMLKWHEEREEFEKCSFIQEGLKTIKQ
jgi:hypothetical protein